MHKVCVDSLIYPQSLQEETSSSELSGQPCRKSDVHVKLLANFNELLLTC